MKTWTTLVLLLAILGWSTARAEYDPDSYFYTKVGFGASLGDETWISDSHIGTSIGVGYTRELSDDWNIYGSIRYQYFNADWRKLTHANGDSYLSHWGLNLEWRHDVPQVETESYFYANIFAGPNSGNGWVDSGTMGTGFGMGYTQLLNRKYNIYGTAFYEHFSQLMAGEPFAADKEESYLDHLGAALILRF